MRSVLSHPTKISTWNLKNTLFLEPLHYALFGYAGAKNRIMIHKNTWITSMWKKKLVKASAKREKRQQAIYDN